MDPKGVKVSDLCADVDAAVAKLPNPESYRRVQYPQGAKPDDAELCRFVVSLQCDAALLQQNVGSVDPATVSEIKKMEREIEFCLAKCNQ